MSDARRSLAEAQAARARFKGVRRDNPERRAALEAADSALAAARRALIPLARRGPQTGRRTNPNAVQELSRTITAERRRLHSALYGSSGARPSAGKRNGAQVRGYLAYVKGSLRGMDEDHRAMLRATRSGDFTATPGGGSYRSMRTRREAAAEMLTAANGGPSLRSMRLELNRRWRDYERLKRGRPNPALAAEVERTRIAIESMRRRLKRAATDNTPKSRDNLPRRDRTRRRFWTQVTIRKAFRDFACEHGRSPTKAECEARSDLPPYQSVLREFGGLGEVR